MIHREGIKIISVTILILAVLCTFLVILIPSGLALKLVILATSFIIILFLCLFFRKTGRRFIPDEHIIFAPADGKVMVVEKTFESESLQENRTQISIFMSVWNVHINWYPLSGCIIYYKYHPGKYLIARYPKSSQKNERNTIVIDNPHTGKILIRQIAGTVARRIISNAHINKNVNQGEELGFIRFGSRVDIFLPPEIPILVKPGDKVRGLLSPIATIQ